jgi:hypothetical protein
MSSSAGLKRSFCRSSRGRAIRVSPRRKTVAPENHERPNNGIPKRKKTEASPQLSCKFNYAIELTYTLAISESAFFTDDILAYRSAVWQSRAPLTLAVRDSAAATGAARS